MTYCRKWSEVHLCAFSLFAIVSQLLEEYIILGVIGLISSQTHNSDGQTTNKIFYIFVYRIPYRTKKTIKDNHPLHPCSTDIEEMDTKSFLPELSKTKSSGGTIHKFIFEFVHNLDFQCLHTHSYYVQFGQKLILVGHSIFCRWKRRVKKNLPTNWKKKSK